VSRGQHFDVRATDIDRQDALPSGGRTTSNTAWAWWSCGGPPRRLAGF